MARHNSALELAYAIQINLAASEEARLQAKRDSMARWRKKHGERYPTRTTPEASAEAEKLRAHPSEEGRRRAQSLEMAADTESYGDWAERVGKARDWPQCDQCDAPRAADDGKGEPIVHQGNYLCRRCASKVGKAYFVEDAVTESVLRKQSTMPLYATAGTNGSGEEGNEDDGNYSNPDERPLYQKTGAWPDELWTNTDPKDRGKTGQRSMHDSEVYYNNKAALPQQSGDSDAQMEGQHGSSAQPGRSGLVRSDDRGRGNGVGPVRAEANLRDRSERGQHRRGDHQHDASVRGRRSNQDARRQTSRPGQEDGLVLGADTRSRGARPGAADHPMDDGQGRQTGRTGGETSGPSPRHPDTRRTHEASQHALIRSNLRKTNDWYANGGQIDAADYQPLPEPSKVDNHVDDQGSTEHHRQEGDQGPGHAKDNPRSCIYCGKQDGHTLLCDRPANKAIDLSFLGPIMTEG